MVTISTPTLIATLGIPGSGKTYFSSRLCDDMDFFHLNSDRMRSELATSPTRSAEETAALFRIMDHIADETLRRKGGVVYDALFSKREYRDRMRQLAANRGAAYLLLWFQVPFEIAVQRASNRVETAGDAAAYYPSATRTGIERIAGTIEEPEDEPFLIVDGLKTYAEQRALLIETLRQTR